MSSKGKEPKGIDTSPSIQSNTRPSLPATAEQSPDSVAKAPTGDQQVDEVVDLQRKRKVIKNDIQRIMKKFDELKHRLYTNKERIIEQELAQMDSNTHPMLKQHLDELEAQRTRRLAIAVSKKNLIEKSVESDMEHTIENIDYMHAEGKKSIRRALFKSCQSQLVQLANENQLKYDDVFTDANLDPALRKAMQLLPKNTQSLTKQEIENDLILMNR